MKGEKEGPPPLAKGGEKPLPVILLEQNFPPWGRPLNIKKEKKKGK
jgi:hypothetical protein